MEFEHYFEHEDIDKEDIAGFEKRLEVDLPRQYKKFLMNYNGGAPEKDIFDFESENQEEQSMVDYFFGINLEKWNLEDNLKDFRGKVPDNLLPIAADPGGNLICMVVEGSRMGEIYFWDHEQEMESPSFENLHYVAENFDAFCTNLY